MLHLIVRFFEFSSCYCATNKYVIAVITIIVGVIKFSLMFVYVKITENINKNIIVVINDIIIPFIIFEIDVVI